jgi:erythromycin esterase
VSAWTPMNVHLADRLGDDYLAIGTTRETSRIVAAGPDIAAGKLFTDLGTPRTGSLDAVMAASHPDPFAVDLRRLTPADAASIQAVSQQRIGPTCNEIRPLGAFDVVIHLPHVNLADPDFSAAAHAADDIQQALHHTKPDQ